MNNFFKNKSKPYLIAEIGGNHEGDFNYAKKLLNLAINSEVNCIRHYILVKVWLIESCTNKTKTFQKI